MPKPRDPKSNSQRTASEISRTGVIEQGNIDLSKRKPVPYRGGFATVYSMSFERDKKQILIPMVVNGKVVSEKEAIKYYDLTGQNLGIYTSVASANRAAKQIHLSEQKRIGEMGNNVRMPSKATPQKASRAMGGPIKAPPRRINRGTSGSGSSY